RGQAPAADLTHEAANGCGDDVALAHEMSLHHAGRQLTDRHCLDQHPVGVAADSEQLDAARADVECVEAERAARTSPPSHASVGSKAHAPRGACVSTR